MAENQERLQRTVERIVSEKGVAASIYYDDEEGALVLTDDAAYAVTADGTVSVATIGEWKNEEEDEDGEN